jgi:hypothetical protein
MPAVRVPAATHTKLQALAASEHRSMGEIVTDLVKRYEEEQFWAAYKQSYEELRKDPAAWNEYVTELREWDSMPNEALDAEPPYFTPEEEEAFLARTETTVDR